MDPNKFLIPLTGDLPESEPEGCVDTFPQTLPPKMYRVLLLNDDFTPMDFVVHILQKFFSKTVEESQAIMLEVHKKGAGTAGLYTLEVGEMKVMQVNQYARANQHPLKGVLEPE